MNDQRNWVWFLMGPETSPTAAASNQASDKTHPIFSAQLGEELHGIRKIKTG
jgi:hypothetical protein